MKNKIERKREIIKLDKLTGNHRVSLNTEKRNRKLSMSRIKLAMYRQTTNHSNMIEH
jgi:hypothetical protein